MDENEEEPFANISPDSGINLHDSTTTDIDSFYELDDVSKKEEDARRSNTDSAEVGRETENQEADDDRDNETDAFVTDVRSQSTNNANTGIVLTEKIGSPEESATFDSLNEILPTKDSGVLLEDKEEVVFDQTDGNSSIYLPAHSALPRSGLQSPSDKTDLEIVPETVNGIKIEDVELSSEIWKDRADIDGKETIAVNSDSQIPGIEENSLKRLAENNIDDYSIQTSAADQLEMMKSRDHLIGSKSVGDLSSLRTLKPNSLAEDAKLVKFSVSTKSVNLMQSNAQFLNKSRNFINFITEKSTNIMEKTLLPQNIAAKYNSILRMTENNPGNYKKSIEDTGSSSNIDTTLNPESSSLHDSEINNLGGCNDDEPLPSNCDIQESTKEERKLFLKCSQSENNCNPNSTPKELEAEITSEHVENSNANSITADMIEEENTTSNYNSLGKIETAMPKENVEVDRRNSETSNRGIEEKESMKKNGIGDTVPNLRHDSYVTISPRRKDLIEHLDKGENDEQMVDLELLSHPAYVKILRDYSSLKNHSEKLLEVVAKVEMENQRLVAENNGELHALQLETLEKNIEQLKNDLKQETAKQESLSKEYLLANKERESMVMKYAMSEKQLIDTQRAREYAERKVNEALKEQELLHTKLKQVQGERTRICNILDRKCHELTDAQKEVDRLKEELSMREVKLKWSQNKLKTELEAHKENQQKLDKALLRMNEMKEECDQIRKESQETIRKFQQSEENKAVTLDHQLKEQQARLILERHVTEDKELSRIQLQKEVETLKQRQHALIEENNTLSLKVQNLEKERLNYDNNLSNLKVIADQRQKEIVDLVGKVSQLETLKLQLKHKEQLLSSNEAEVERLRQSNTELQSDMEWCREREAHMLDFTQKLTDKNVRLQSEFTALEAKNEQLELEQGPLHDQIKELSSKVKSLEISLASEKSKRTEECELLARHVAEQTQLARNLAQKLEDSQGENSVLRRKQQISVKEMTKELQQCKKRLDAFETGSPSNSLDRTSRTGSSSSLSTGETLNGTVSDNSNSGDHIIQSVEPDRQTLVERIVKLQRIRVRQAEKLDFLEEHTRTLVNELQKKAKIIKNYILHENPDAMGSNERDRNKAELARHGGIMASVYNQRVSDDNMTLELSLEINQKLQAVLEDTLLKNITLKDSIDTLGGEIARLTMQNNRRP